MALLLIAGLWLYIQSDGFAIRIRPFIVGPLQEVLGPGARIGRIKANLLPLYVEVRDITVPSSRKQEAVAVRRVRVYLNPLPLIYRTISLSSITVLEPRFTAERSADGEIDLTEVFRSVLANIERMRSSAQSASPYTVQIRTVTVRNGQVALSDEGTRSAISLSRMDLRAKLNLPGSSASIRLTSGVLIISTPAYRNIEARVRSVFSVIPGKINIDSCEIVSEDTRLAASGSIGLAKDGDLDLKLTSRVGQRSLGRLTNILGRDKKGNRPALETVAQVAGNLRDPVINGSLRLSGIVFPGIEIREAGAEFTYRSRVISVMGRDWKLVVNARQVAIQELSLEASYDGATVEVMRAVGWADDAVVRASGSVSPSEGYRLAIELASTDRGRTLSLLSGISVEGAVSVRGTLAGPLAAPWFYGQLAAGPVTVRRVAFTRVSGSLAFRDRILSLSGTTIEHARSRYDIDGSINLQGTEPVYQATLAAKRADVSGIVTLFYRALPLDITASGEINFSGTRSAYTGAARLDLEAGVAYGEPFDSGTLSADLTTGRISFPSVILRKKGGLVKGAGWIGFDGSYDAHVEGLGVDLSGIRHLEKLPLSGPCRLEARSSGSFSAPLVQANLDVDDLSFHQASLGATTATLEIKEGVLSFGAELEDDAFSMNGTMRLNGTYPWSLAATVRVDDIDPSELVESRELLSRVRVTAEGTILARGNGFDLKGLNGSALFRKVAFTFGELRLENEGETKIGIESGRLIVRSLLLTGSSTRLSMTGGTRLGKDVDLELTGDANLSLLRILYREVEHADGAASLKLAVVDEWASPEITGELHIRNGQVKIRNVSQKFTALNGTVSFDRNRIITEGVSGEVGGGTITVTGSAQLEGSKLVDFSSKASIENVTVRYPQGLTATLGGVLYYDGDTAAQNLSGEIGIRRARYEKRVEWKSMLVDFSKGLSSKAKEDLGWIGETQMRVHFYGKEDILFESNLAKIPLSADILLQGTVRQPQILGRIEARAGEVYFRRNVFRIIHASADFTDPSRMNAILDVQAETQVREYRIRLGVSGTADRAVVTFVSDPPLSDSDILSLLALGRRTEELKGKEAGIGVGEATSFATGKFQDILESRARSLTGLDRFQVDPYLSKTDVAVPRVTAGKTVVQDKLFFTYSSNVGATTPEQIFRIEYILNRNVSLRGEYDEMGQIGADVKFRFEFR